MFFVIEKKAKLKWKYSTMQHLSGYRIKKQIF